MQAIRKEGLRLMSEGVVRHIKARAIENLRELKPRQDDVLLLTVKSQDTEAAAKQLSRPLLATNLDRLTPKRCA